MLVHVLKVFAPSQFVNQLVLNAQTVLVVHRASDFGHAEKTMGEIGRQMRDRTIQSIA